MRTATILLLLALVLCVRCETQERKEDNDEGSALECVFLDDTTDCLRRRFARDIDRIETEVSGKKSEPPMSAVIEQAGDFVAEVVQDVAGGSQDLEEPTDEEEGRGLEEARRKKFGKKKKKHLQKLIALAMLFKAKLGLILQLISTHFQVKFFVIAIISLLLNAARFWLDLKKSHPAKVIYYEHAQHQHHYDHDDHDHGSYWGRSTKDAQDLAYNAYVPEE